MNQSGEWFMLINVQHCMFYDSIRTLRTIYVQRLIQPRTDCPITVVPLLTDKPYLYVIRDNEQLFSSKLLEESNVTNYFEVICAMTFIS